MYHLKFLIIIYLDKNKLIKNKEYNNVMEGKPVKWSMNGENHGSPSHYCGKGHRNRNS